ncbi:MAG: nuclear transport factor 2 family protein [Fuerstia sp.]|nr:nuclear transport factor 2 family protein [Fuerstiella sp.]
MQNDEQAIRQFVTIWLSATEAGDGEAVLRMIADDVVFLTPGQPPMNKADFAAGLAALKNVRIRIASEICEIKVVGDWAWCWTQLTVVITPPGDRPPVTRSGNALSILEKRADAWVIVRDANMLTVAQS